jgi:heme/copper-type cytochrome/quinol oxidase subunit 2
VFGGPDFVITWLLLVGVLSLFVLVPLGLLVWALVDLATRSEAEWRWSGQDRLGWVLIIVLVGLIGPFLYLVVARPKLVQTRRYLAASGLPAWPLGPPPGGRA